MNLHSFCQHMHFNPDTENLLSSCWNQLLTHTEDGLPDFLQETCFTRHARLCLFSPEILQRMHAVAAAAAGDPLLARWAAMLRYAFYEAPQPPPLQNLPSPQALLGENAGIFSLMVCQSALPLIQRTHRRLRLPESMLAETAQVLQGNSRIHEAAHEGIPGCMMRQMPWLRHHIDGELFRIGRLEYIFSYWHRRLPAVYRHCQSRQLAVLCRSGWNFNSAGDMLPADSSEKPFFTSVLEETDGQISGTPLTPDGRIHPESRLFLDLNLWIPLFTPWDLLPGIHIPADGGSLVQDTIRDSLSRARNFFRTFFATDIKAFLCSSWILNPVWELEMPNSHLACLQRNVFLLPPTISPGNGLFHIYGREQDPRTMPAVTGLHKALCRIYNRGEPLKYGTMFFLAEDIDSFGCEPYRKPRQSPFADARLQSTDSPPCKYHSENHRPE